MEIRYIKARLKMSKERGNGKEKRVIARKEERLEREERVKKEETAKKEKRPDKKEKAKEEL